MSGNKKFSSRGAQSSLFFKELKKHMNVQSACKEALASTAEAYREDGCLPDEIEELLVLDGFDRDMANGYLHQPQASAKGKVWGFEVEDAYGNVTSHEDLGLEVYASSEPDAYSQTERLLKEIGYDFNFDRVVNVCKIEEL